MVREVVCGRCPRLRAVLHCVFVVAAAAGLLPGKSAHAASRAPGASEPARAAAPHAAAPHAKASLRTRFVVALDRAAKFEVFALTGPNRVVIDLPAVDVHLPARPTNGPVGLVRDFRGGLVAKSRMRVVIDVTRPVVVEKAQMAAAGPGKRAELVLELVPAEQAIADASTPAKARPAGMSRVGLGTVQPPLPRPAVRPEQLAKRTYKPLIVLDPGHGGHDSGAVNNGTVEKDVVLAFAKVLREKLLATGRYRVEMTRSDDTFVPLDERREFAERRNAALFIAIHADYADSNARGATIYSLRESMASELAAAYQSESPSEILSTKENARVRSVGADARMVRNILADLASRETQVTRDRTGTFVKAVIENMGQTTNLKDQPDRGAGFAVLKTAKVPAVLIELAYVTNRSDAALLRSSSWRHKVAHSIMSAVDNYFSHRTARLPL